MFAVAHFSTAEYRISHDSFGCLLCPDLLLKVPNRNLKILQLGSPSYVFHLLINLVLHLHQLITHLFTVKVKLFNSINDASQLLGQALLLFGNMIQIQNLVLMLIVDAAFVSSNRIQRICEAFSNLGYNFARINVRTSSQILAQFNYEIYMAPMFLNFVSQGTPTPLFCKFDVFGNGPQGSFQIFNFSVPFYRVRFRLYYLIFFCLFKQSFLRFILVWIKEIYFGFFGGLSRKYTFLGRPLGGSLSVYLTATYQTNRIPLCFNLNPV